MLVRAGASECVCVSVHLEQSLRTRFCALPILLLLFFIILSPTTAVLVARCSGFSPAGAKVRMPVVNNFCWVISFKVKGSSADTMLPLAPMVTAADAGFKQPERMHAVLKLWLLTASVHSVG